MKNFDKILAENPKFVSLDRTPDGYPKPGEWVVGNFSATDSRKRAYVAVGYAEGRKDSLADKEYFLLLTAGGEVVQLSCQDVLSLGSFRLETKRLFPSFKEREHANMYAALMKDWIVENERMRAWMVYTHKHVVERQKNLVREFVQGFAEKGCEGAVQAIREIAAVAALQDVSKIAGMDPESVSDLFDSI